MTPKTRPATLDDIPRLVDLLISDAEERHAKDAVLWKLADDAPAQIEKSLTFAMMAEQQPFQQFWHVAEDEGQIAGVIHAMMLPVPPIYAGPLGDPGLILPDSCVAADAPRGTAEGLLAAAEIALHTAGARIKMASYVTGEEWRNAFAAAGYDPITLYLSRNDFDDQGLPTGVRNAKEEDVPGIVERSAENRRILFEIDPFWEIHPDADQRFAAWMTRSLTLPDRDMMVLGKSEKLQGYIIAQPASRLHFPPAHDIVGTGVIDDFFHPEFANTRVLDQSIAGAGTLLRAAETAFARRNKRASFVVCPARWTSKIELLESAGYRTVMAWSIKR